MCGIRNRAGGSTCSARRSYPGRIPLLTMLVACSVMTACETVDSWTIRSWGDVPGVEELIASDTALDMPIEEAPWLDEAVGHVVFHMDGRLYRAAAEPNAPLHDLDVLLDALSPGTDLAAGVSGDGTWMVIQSSRELCRESSVQSAEEEPWGCLLTAQFGDRTAVLPDGSLRREAGVFGVAALQPIRTPDGWRIHDATVPAIHGGSLVVFGASSGVESMNVTFEGPQDQIHIYAMTRQPGDRFWSAPRALTLDSPYPLHGFPSISPDGTTVLMDCHHDPEVSLPRSICEVKVDGTGFHVLVEPEDGRVEGQPAGMGGANHHARYAPDGSVVFESDWPVLFEGSWGPCESVWRLVPGVAGLQRVSPDQCNDNTPCVLPDGRVVSLWLPRHGHELKTLDPSSHNYFMMTPGRDVTDISIACTW